MKGIREIGLDDGPTIRRIAYIAYSEEVPYWAQSDVDLKLVILERDEGECHFGRQREP